MFGTDRRVATPVADADPLAGGGVSVGRFHGLDPDGRFLVTVPGQAVPLVAISTIAIGVADRGAPVVVAWEREGARRPVIVGRAHERGPAGGTAVTVDGERLVLRAEQEIELRCGDARIVLTRAGKVLIRGAYVLSRSRGVNKIKGAMVDIN